MTPKSNPCPQCGERLRLYPYRGDTANRNCLACNASIEAHARLHMPEAFVCDRFDETLECEHDWARFGDHARVESCVLCDSLRDLKTGRISRTRSAWGRECGRDLDATNHCPIHGEI